MSLHNMSLFHHIALPCHCITSPSHCTIMSLHHMSLFHHIELPRHCITSPCHCTIISLHHISLFHHIALHVIVLPHCVTAPSYHCTTCHCSTILHYHVIALLQCVIAPPCYCAAMSLHQLVIASVSLLHRVIAMSVWHCHVIPPSHYCTYMHNISK